MFFNYVKRGELKLQDLRCRKCNKLLGKYLECKQLEIKCPRCGLSNFLREDLPGKGQEKSYPA
jgi:phage FluMu protein Com